MAARAVALCLLLWQVAVAASEPCSTPGTVRTDDAGRLLAFCTPEGEWTSLAAAGAGTASAGAGRAELECATRPGAAVCNDNCTAVGICLAGGQWAKWEDCGAKDMVCARGACVANTEFTCGQVSEPAQCRTEGVFPSLWDCTAYMTCSLDAGGALVATWHRCAAGALFDACTGRCDVRVQGDCPWASDLETCRDAGDWGIAPNNDRLFYVCTTSLLGTLEPEWLSCPEGHFDVAHGGCVDSDVPGCRWDPAASTTTSAPNATDIVDNTTVAVETTTVEVLTTVGPPTCSPTQNETAEGCWYHCLYNGTSITFCDDDCVVAGMLVDLVASVFDLDI